MKKVKITRGVGSHGQTVMFADGERILSVSGLFEGLGVKPDFSSIPTELLERAIYVGNETHRVLETFPEKEPFHKDDEVSNCVVSFYKWFNSSEKIGYLPNHSEQTEQDELIKGMRLQARIDNMFRIDGKKVVVDYKTGSKIDLLAKVQVTAQKLIFQADACATLHLFKDGSIGKLEYWNEEELLISALEIYRDNDEFDRIVKGVALFAQTDEIEPTLAEQYILAKKALSEAVATEKALKKRIEKELAGRKGKFESADTVLKFDWVNGRTTTKYDTAKMIEDGIDTEYYAITKTGKGYYKTSVKEV